MGYFATQISTNRLPVFVRWDLKVSPQTPLDLEINACP
jgi:hypothetical protein